MSLPDDTLPTGTDAASSDGEESPVSAPSAGDAAPSGEDDKKSSGEDDKKSSGEDDKSEAGGAKESRCTACRSPLATDAMFCKRCGAPQPGAPTCPHCGAIADTSPHDEVVLKCDACGAPRVVINHSGIELSGQEKEHLEQAKSARLKRLAWWVGGTASALAAVGLLGTTALVSLLLGLSIIAAGIGITMTLPFALLAWLAFRKAKDRTKDVVRSVDAAWLSAAKDVTQQSKEPVTATALSKMLPLTEARTEHLLAQLTVDDMLHSDITPEGRLSFTPALRIEEPVDGAADTEMAELEQLAAEEAAAEQRERARRD